MSKDSESLKHDAEGYTDQGKLLIGVATAIVDLIPMSV